MGIIAARFIRVPREPWKCDDCRQRFPTASSKVRLYGNAESEKPWTIHLCLPCARKSAEHKCNAAIADALALASSRRRVSPAGERP